MRAKVKLPRSRRGWVFVGVFVAVVLLGSWPIIPLFNRNVLVFGMPLLMVWSVAIVFLTSFTMWLSGRMGVK
jgi:hypothetical protein